jgi:hypothetical protein
MESKTLKVMLPNPLKPPHSYRLALQNYKDSAENWCWNRGYNPSFRMVIFFLVLKLLR